MAGCVQDSCEGGHRGAGAVQQAAVTCWALLSPFHAHSEDGLRCMTKRKAEGGPPNGQARTVRAVIATPPDQGGQQLLE